MNGGSFDLGSISPDALSNAISKISEHPEIISMVASALGKTTEESAPQPTPQTSSSLQPSASSLPQQTDLSSLIGSIAPVMAALGGKRKKDPREEHRDALLCALKPYLSEDRRQMVDKIMKLGQIGDILKIIK